MFGSKQVGASASRSIVNYRLTCGFSASVYRPNCAESGQTDGVAPFGRAPPGLAGNLTACAGLSPSPKRPSSPKIAPIDSALMEGFATTRCGHNLQKCPRQWEANVRIG